MLSQVAIAISQIGPVAVNFIQKILNFELPKSFYSYLKKGQ